jgi:hypothetical protein
MRILVFILTSCLFVSGCAWLPSSPKKHNPAEGETSAMPVMQNVGRVAKVNATFVILTFPVGGIPRVDQKLNVYRKGVKVGEVKVTGPERDINTVADIISGEPKVSDEVRAD